MSQTENFPVPVDAIALIDLDGTLLDGKYKVTDDNIYSVVNDVQELGWVLGLSSDSPYEAMKLWGKRFGLAGPIIAERGALTEVYGHLKYDSAASNLFRTSGEQIYDYFSSIEGVVEVCNPVEFLREDRAIGQPGDRVILINGHRKNSLNIFARVVDANGRLMLSDEAIDSAVAEIRQFYPPVEGLVEDLNHEYGLVIVGNSSDTKRKGTKQVLAGMGLSSTGMIGNSMGDYVGKDIAVHYAVANSSDDFKQKSDYTAHTPFTSGVVEILGKLTSSSTGGVR